MSEQQVRLTIDGRDVETRPGTLLVEAAKQAGIDIPVFCYHPKLNPVGVCRMCLVEVEGIPKPVTACTTPVRDGMVVRTQTEQVKRLQKGVLEFLLLNHPLDCPVCDKGGECPLQDNTFRYGPTVSRMEDGKLRKRKAVGLGRFIVLDEERCILCRRCTRFDHEVAREGNLIIGMRGYAAVVTTATGGKPFDSYFSGNTIELCPVGALTSELYRFKARPWDLSSVPSTCTGCSLGCNVRLDYRFGELLRVVSRENPKVDGGWLCDRGRFNYKYIHSDERLTQPLVRKDGQLVPVSWPEALGVVGQRLRDIRREAGGAAIGLIGGGRLTNEAAYLFQKLGRAVLGTPHVDHRCGAQVAVSLADYPGRVTDVDGADVILLVDIQPQERIPVLDLRIRRALEGRGAKVIGLGPALQAYRGPAMQVPVVPGATAAALRQLARAVAGTGGAEKGEPLDAEVAASVAGALLGARKLVALWGGADARVGAALLELLDAVKQVPREEGERSLHVLVPGEQANSRGAEFMGVRPGWLPGYRRYDDREAREALERAWQVALPDGPGWNTGQMLAAAAAGELKAMIVAGANPAVTYPNGVLVRRALEAVDFLVVVDLFLTETARYADVVLPAAPFAAAEGTYTNVDGWLQPVEAGMKADGESRADSDIFQAIAGAVGGRPLVGSAQEFQWELQQLLGDLISPEGQLPAGPRELWEDDPVSMPAGATPEDGQGGQRGTGGRGAEADAHLALVPVERLFAGGGTSYFDPGIRRARPSAEARLHPEDARALQVRAGDRLSLEAAGEELELEVAVAEDVQPGTVQVVQGLPEAPVNLLLSEGRYPRVRVRRLVLEEVG